MAAPPPAQPPSPTRSVRSAHSLQAPGGAGWQPGLHAIQDEHSSLYDDYYAQPLEPPPPIGANSIMRHQNRSVPSLPATHQAPGEPVPPLPAQPYDPTQVLDRFTAMHIHEPVQRGTSAMSYRTINTVASDPVPRAGTSMSMRPMQPPYHQGGAPYPPRGPSLPVSPAQSRGPPMRSGYPPSQYSSDTASFHSASGRNSIREEGEEGGLAYDQPEEGGGDRTSSYSQNSGNYAASTYSHNPPPQQWQQPPAYGYPGGQGYYPPGPQDPYHNSVGDVLGMGPAPGAPPPPPMQGGYAQPPYQQSPYAQSVRSFSSSQSAPSIAPQQGIYPPGVQPLQRPLSDPSVTGEDGEEEFARRPPIDRQGTTASVALSTAKTKAVDLAAPPYTKQYVDEYRQRIKNDPDPDAHFQYAKYLVDASKKVGGEQAKDNRSLRKYRETLAQEALKVIRRLATQGEPHDESQFYLANCFGTGALGLQVDHERAYHLYLQAAKQNHAAAAYRVAVCNEIGAGTRKEPARAAAFYRKAASLGDTAAMYKLGVILLKGLLGEARNPRDAVGWLKRAAEQADEANPHALHELALLHEAQDGLVPYDPMYAKRLLTQAAQLGYTHSQFKLGQMYESGSASCAVDPKRSIAWYTKAAEKGHPEAELALSGWYLTGVDGILKQSDSEAYLWARRAANKGLAKAEYAVGYYAEVGIGIKQDIEFAKRWYMRAATQGNKRAMNRLTEMKRGGRQNQGRPTRQDAKDDCVIA